MSLVPGFNLEGVIETNSIDIEESLSMREEKPRKKKAKYDFSHLFQKPKGEKNMGMDDFGEGITFEGLF